MAERADDWRQTSAWAGIAVPGRGGRMSGEPGISIELLAPSLALIVALSGEDETPGALAGALGCTPPQARRSGGNLLWSAPRQWLWIGDDPVALVRLADALAGIAAVSDLSDAKACLRLSGPNVRDALAKGLPIDLDPSVFAVGDVAVTAVAGMSVHLWLTDDRPGFVVIVPRTMAGSFWRLLTTSAAEFGYAVTVDDGRG